MKTGIWTGYLYTHVHNSIIPNSQKLEHPSAQQMNEQIKCGKHIQLNTINIINPWYML